jgi:hypothetical protein
MDNNKTGADFFRKYADIIAEAEEELTEAPKCKICNKPQKEDTDGNLKYCQGH